MHIRSMVYVVAFTLAALTCQGTAVAADADQVQQQAALHALAGHDIPAAGTVQSITLAPWKHGPASDGPLWVVAALILPPGDESVPQLWTGVLRRDGDGFQLLAGDRSERIDSALTLSTLLGAGLQLDLIPYRINAHETAFGVRFSNSFNSTGDRVSREQISLYRYAVQTLTPIFTALTDDSGYDKYSAGQCAQRAAGAGKEPSDGEQSECDDKNSNEDHYVIAFGTHTSQGYYDLLVRKSGVPASAKAKAGLRFSWNGKTYEPRHFDGGL